MKQSFRIGALVVAATILSAPRALRAQAANADTTASIKLFSSLAGRWSCDGGFPSGRKLSADLTITPVAMGHAIAIEHLDRAPGTFWQYAVWASDARTSRLVAVGHSGSTQNRNVSPVTLTAKEWSATSASFETDTAKTPVSRYVYTVTSDGKLKYGWYVGANNHWALGDSLVCVPGKN